MPGRTRVKHGRPGPPRRSCDCARRFADAAALVAREGGILLYLRRANARAIGAPVVPSRARADDGAAGAVLADLGFASPTFKATYTGLLKLFLDQFAGGTGLQDVVAVPLMLGAGPAHAMAPDLTLKPVLAELGGTCALPGLYLLDSGFADDPALPAYAERWGPVARAVMALRVA